VGDTESLLHQFFMGAHKILLGYYEDVMLEDVLPIENMYSGSIKILQDFLAPFKLFLKPTFQQKFTQIDDVHFPKQISIQTKTEVKIGSKILKHTNYTIEISQNGIEKFTIQHQQKTIIATCIKS
jgi:prephenate dehydratase